MVAEGREPTPSQPDALARDSTGNHASNAMFRNTPFVPQGRVTRRSKYCWRPKYSRQGSRSPATLSLANASGCDGGTLRVLPLTSIFPSERCFALFWVVLILISLGLVPGASSPFGPSRANAGEIGVPLADPKFPINIFAHEARRQNQGAYEVLTFTGGVRLYQGSFILNADEAVIWMDPTKPEVVSDQNAMKYLVETRGNCEIRFGDGQVLQDQQWTGRLFSQFNLETRADVWLEPAGPPPDLTSPITGQATLNNRGGDVKPAIEWTAADDAMHIQLAAQFANAAMVGQSGQQGMIIGNPAMGGTVIDAGTMNLPQHDVSSFQIGPPPPVSALGPAPVAAPVAMDPNLTPRRVGAKSFEFSGRGSAMPSFEGQARPDRGDAVATFAGGIRFRFRDVTLATQQGVLDLGTVLIEADRAVVWTTDLQRLLSGRVDDLPIELYLEGNVIFQQGARRVYAERMYYNVQSEYGMILGAELLTDAPQYEGILRVKADVIQQRSRENFLAHQAALTSSRLGVPRYWLQADEIELRDRSSQSEGNFISRTFRGTPTDETGMKARARHNFIYVEGFPVFYWPVLDTNVDTSSFYVTGVKYKRDDIFGNQGMIDWNLYQIFGMQAIDGTKWTLSTDYLEKRGLGIGTNFQYNVPEFILGGNADGMFDFWGIRDKGNDYLGGDRWNITPEETTRGRLILRHRQYLTPDTELWAEAGWISDRNFQEQYFENEWDNHKDTSTALRLRQYLGNQMLDLSAQFRINDFHTETSWLPRLDHYWLGQSIGQHFTYYTHSDVGYAKQRVASTPTDPADSAKFQLQPNEVNVGGVQAMTRHELNLPIDTGITKVVPFIAGEAAYWGEDVNGDQLTRLTGQAGWRSATPIWKVYPGVQNSIFNLNGLAHKMSIESQFLYADTNKDLDLLPLYNPLDDNSQEHFRRRLVYNTFGGTLPDQFDARYYAARQSMQRYVSATSNEIVTDQMQSRVGLHQRFQTKRGVPGRERIADVVEFDVDAILFGDRDRDNFGETIGAINYDFRYHIGDRFSIISDGYYDLFEDGLKATTVGGVVNRPGRGDLYVGLTSLEGPISSTLLTSSVNYRMNEKWLGMGGVSYDFSGTGNIGQSFAITRIGESFLFRVGATYDYGRENFSFQFALEPRFFQRTGLGLGVAGGQVIAPAGQFGLE